MDFKDYYKILGMPRTASEKEIKLTYRKMARQYHPDLHPGDKTAETRFREINEAYEVLSDPEKRKKYDMFGQYWRGGQAAGTTPPPGFETIFANLGDLGSVFGGGVGKGHKRNSAAFSDFFELLFGREGDLSSWDTNARAPRQDQEHGIQLTLEEAGKGARKNIELTLDDPCAACQGKGGFWRNPPGRSLCVSCGGKGVVPRRKRIEVKIPAGVTASSKIRIPGQLQGGGDLYLRVGLLPHHIFQVKGRDLHCELLLPLSQAMLGGEAELPTLFGKVTITIPPETEHGKNLRLAGQGLPALSGEPTGDMYAKISVVFPKHLSPKEIELFKELAKLRKEQPRTVSIGTSL